MPHLPHLMPESWVALGGVVVLVVWALYGLSGLIDGCLAAARDISNERWYQRKLMQQNINELIIASSSSSAQLLKDALRDSIVEYRQLP